MVADGGEAWRDRRPLVPLVLLLAVAMLLGGCGRFNFFQEPPDAHLEVRNQTDQPLTIFRVSTIGDEDLEREWSDVAAGEHKTVRLGRVDDCYLSGFVARAEDGTEVARLESPVCDGDVWLIR